MNDIKPLRSIASSKADLSAMPLEVRRHVGYALYDAQEGGKHHDTKILKGFGDAGVIEIVTRHDGDTFRAFTLCGLPVPSMSYTPSRRRRSAGSQRRNRTSN
jgi:phage-related protein